MITENTIYWITRLDNIRYMSVLVCLIGILVGAFAFYRWWDIHDRWWLSEDSYLAHMAWVFFPGLLAAVLFLVGCGILLFVPSTKEMVAIKLIPKIVNSEFTQKELPEEAKELCTLAKRLLADKVTKGEQ